MDQAQPAGDAHLNSLDMRLWGLVQHVLFHWRTQVIFKQQSYIVPVSMGGPRRGYIDFFVPVDSPHCLEIVQFLEQELEDLRTEDHEMFDTLMPGTEVRIKVLPFSGVTPYMTQAQSKKLVNDFMQSFLARLQREKNQKGETE